MTTMTTTHQQLSDQTDKKLLSEIKNSCTFLSLAVDLTATEIGFSSIIYVSLMAWKRNASKKISFENKKHLGMCTLAIDDDVDGIVTCLHVLLLAHTHSNSFRKVL